MKTMKKVFSLLLGLFIVGSLLSVTVLAQPQTPKPTSPITFKVAHEFGPKNAIGIAGLHFKQAVDVKLAGRVKMEYFPAGQLFDTKACHRELKSGSIQCTVASTSYMQSFDPLWGIAEYPFIFNNAEHFWATLEQSEAGRQLITRTIEGGTTFLGKALSTKHSMMKYIFSNKPIRGIRDFKGLKLRNPPGWMMAKIMDNLGASNVTISIAEFTTALQQGMVDGTMTNAMGWIVWGGLLRDKSPNILNFPFGSAYSYSAVNTQWWNSLPYDIKKDLEPLIAEFGDEIGRLWWEQYLVMWKDIAELEKQGKFGVVVPSADFAKALTDCQTPLYDEFINKIPSAKEVLDVAKKIAPKYPVKE